MKLLAKLLILAAAMFAPPALAQQTALPSAYICNACTGSLSVTATSSSVALPSTSPPYGTLTVYNGGAKTAYFVQGGSSVVATTSGIAIAAGSYAELSVNGTYIAAITGGSDTTTLTFYQSNGLIAFGTGSGGSGGGSFPNPIGVVGTNGTSIASPANPLDVEGVGVAQGSTTSGQSVSPIGARTLNAPAADTSGKTNMPWLALSGAAIVYPYSNPENLVSGLTAAMTGTTSTSLIAAPASGLRNYVTNLVCTNSHATVGTFVIVQDGSAGTTFYEAYAAAVGGGFSIQFPAPLKQPTLATALFVADVTTGANVICSASGFKAP